jgi:tetratricopeptide (TPR) repeat protein
MEAHDYTLAAETLQSVLALRHQDGEAAFLLGRARRCLEDYSAARSMLSEARLEGYVPDLIDLEHALIRLQSTGLGGPDEQAMRLWVTARHPEDRVILEALSRAAIDSFAMAEAHGFLSTWIDRAPNDWLPLVWRADILARFRLLDRARSDYEQALKCRPGAPGAEAGLGKALLLDGQDTALAETQLRAGLKADPNNTNCRAALAEVFERTGRMEEAFREAQQVLATQPNHTEALRLLARLDLDAGRTTEALIRLELADRLAPGDVATVSALAQALARAGKTEKAQQQEKRVTELRTDSKALEQLTQEILDKSANADVRFRIGTTMARMGRTTEAQGWYSSALRLDPNHAAARQALGNTIPKQ